MKHFHIALALIALAITKPYTPALAAPFILPDGYQLPLGQDPDTAGPASSTIIRKDFDGDGVSDAFFIAEHPGEDETVIMATLDNGKIIRASRTFEVCCATVSLAGDTVSVGSTGMRYFTTYKFRWDSRARDFRLIGFDTESFGNAANDGKGKSSLNLLTGHYRAVFYRYDHQRRKLLLLPVVDKNLSPEPPIYLAGFDENTFEHLLDIDSRNQPAEVPDHAINPHCERQCIEEGNKLKNVGVIRR